MCERSVISNDEILREYLVMRLEAALTNVEEVMQYIDRDRRLLQLQSHICEYLHRFQLTQMFACRQLKNLTHQVLLH